MVSAFCYKLSQRHLEEVEGKQTYQQAEEEWDQERPCMEDKIHRLLFLRCMDVVQNQRNLIIFIEA